jgi:very-short-patch-repair endonuclease
MKKKSLRKPHDNYALMAKVFEKRWPGMEREYRFDPTRRWRFDFAWPPEDVALEVEGGVWIAGRHSRGAGMVNDMEKYNTAALQGWRILRVTPKDMENGQAMVWLEGILGR